MESKAARLACANDTDQIVLVESAGGTSARLSLHEREGGVWRELLSCDAEIGKNGVGKQREGDYKTPLGCFSLSMPFGILPDPGSRQDYIHVDEQHCWCGCSKSGHYNRLMDMRACSHACAKPEEHLLDYPGEYNYAMFIGYNCEGVPEKGSCIFLHCFGSSGYTAGCVAVPEEVMKRIIRWARPGVRIVIEKTMME